MKSRPGPVAAPPSVDSSWEEPKAANLDYSVLGAKWTSGPYFEESVLPLLCFSACGCGC